jgi:hypothetical protein
MNGIIVLVSIVLILQVVMFFVIRAKRKKEKANSVIDRYNIKTAGDAFRIMNDPTLPEEDRMEIEKLYNGEKS